MVVSKNLSAQGVRNQGESLMDNHLPSPPLKKIINPGLCGWTRSVLKKIDDAGPEDLIVEVPVYSAPRVNTRKREPNLPQSLMLASES